MNPVCTVTLTPRNADVLTSAHRNVFFLLRSHGLHSSKNLLGVVQEHAVFAAQTERATAAISASRFRDHMREAKRLAR
eukprot:SAG31_NODE_302_length_18087_cov_97.056982_2_plen_78_part_00